MAPGDRAEWWSPQSPGRPRHEAGLAARVDAQGERSAARPTPPRVERTGGPLGLRGRRSVLSPYPTIEGLRRERERENASISRRSDQKGGTMSYVQAGKEKRWVTGLLVFSLLCLFLPAAEKAAGAVPKAATAGSAGEGGDTGGTMKGEMRAACARFVWTGGSGQQAPWQGGGTPQPARRIDGARCVNGGPGGTCFLEENCSCFLAVAKLPDGSWSMGCQSL